jgi:hypothetical protein
MQQIIISRRTDARPPPIYLVSWIPGYVNNLLGKKADLVTLQEKTVMLFLSEFIKVMLDRNKNLSNVFGCGLEISYACRQNKTF